MGNRNTPGAKNIQKGGTGGFKTTGGKLRPLGFIKTWRCRRTRFSHCRKGFPTGEMWAPLNPKGPSRFLVITRAKPWGGCVQGGRERTSLSPVHKTPVNVANPLTLLPFKNPVKAPVPNKSNHFPLFEYGKGGQSLKSKSVGAFAGTANSKKGDGCCPTIGNLDQTFLAPIRYFHLVDGFNRFALTIVI